MASDLYKGTKMRISYDGKTLYHAQNCDLDISTKLESIATKDTDGEVNTPGNYSWKLSASALFANVPVGDTDHIAGSDLIDFQLEGTALDIEFTTNETGDKIYSGQVYVDSSKISAAVGQTVTGSFGFTGNGNLTSSVVA